jgi:hypothetical protein
MNSPFRDDGPADRNDLNGFNTGPDLFAVLTGLGLLVWLCLARRSTTW